MLCELVSPLVPKYALNPVRAAGVPSVLKPSCAQHKRAAFAATAVVGHPGGGGVVQGGCAHTLAEVARATTATRVFTAMASS